MNSFLEAAISEARQGMREGGIPIGSVIVHGGDIIGRGHNRRVQRKSVILHGEMDAMENASRQPASKNLSLNLGKYERDSTPPNEVPLVS